MSIRPEPDEHALKRWLLRLSPEHDHIPDDLRGLFEPDERWVRAALRATESVVLPDDALVVRGGLSSTRSLQSNARKSHRRTGHWSVSGAAGIDIDLATLVGVYPMPQKSLRYTTAGALRREGFDVTLTGPPGHCTIWLPVAPDDPLDTELLEVLRSLLSDPVPNPSAHLWD